MSKLAGYTVMGLPFAAAAIFGIGYVGLAKTLLTFGITGACAICFYLGVRLLED